VTTPLGFPLSPVVCCTARQLVHPAHIPQEVAGRPRPDPPIPATQRRKDLLFLVIPARPGSAHKVE
jgi:hypothetical protein